MSDPKHKGWYSRGYVPHLDAPNVIQHITYHLADSLPKQAIAHMMAQQSKHPDRDRQHRIDALLDAGLGSCILRRPVIAEIVESALFYGDGERYRLLAWTVMPNHVHVLIEQIESLGKIVNSWKRSTSKYIRALRCSDLPQPIWQRDYWDRYIRNDEHYRTVVYYIDQNPVKAGLARAPEAWPWGSARFL